jgi:hypothetical protein
MSKTKWMSRYSPQKPVAFRQWVAEILCERKAHNLDKDLPLKFWNIPEWKGYYFFCLREVDKILKDHSEHSIYQALKAKKTIFSLRAPAFKKELKKQEKVSRPQVEPKIVKQEEVNTFTRRSVSTKSVFDKIQELE